MSPCRSSRRPEEIFEAGAFWAWKKSFRSGVKSVFLEVFR